MSAVKSATKIHEGMIKSLLYASLTDFYNRIPLGRIINRLSKDLRELDEPIGFVVRWAIRTNFNLISSLIICVYASTPLVLIPVVIVLVISFRFQRYYLKTQR